MNLPHVVRGLLLLITVLVFGACEPLPAVTPVGVINERIPLVLVPVCGYPTALAAAASSKSARLMWAFSPTMQLISSADSMQFCQAARHQGRFYVYDRDADPANSRTMPLGQEMTPCPEANEKLALVKPSKVYLLEGKVVPIPPPPCKLLTERRALVLFEPPSESLRADTASARPNPKPDGRYLGQSAHGKGTIRAPAHPNPVRQAQEQELKEVVTKSYAMGKKIGSTVQGIESGLSFLSSHCSRFDDDLRENPDILADIQNKVAKTLNDLPIPSTLTDSHLQASSEAAFSEGFEAGVGSKKLEFLALNTASTVAILLFPNAYVATETLAAKAVRLAFERLRRIPIYVPAVTNGAGFFLKLPKTPPANVNGPSLPAVSPPAAKTPPAITPPAPAPFGNLSRAAEFGVQTESKLGKMIAGQGLEKHHLIEQRFSVKMENDRRMNLTIAVTAAEHQEFTNKWRQAIAYGEAGTRNAGIGRAEIINAARKIYASYPAILKALDL
jgi:hypothetical protein